MSPEVAVREVGGVGVARISGDVDISNVQDLAERLAAHVEPGRPLVLDVTQVPFIDSAGVRLLDDLDRRTAGGFRVVVPDRGGVRLALRLTAFPEELVAPTVEDAVAALA